MTERQVVEKVAEHLQKHWPDVVYRFDLAADMKLTKGQAARHKKLHPHRGYPDLFIAKTRPMQSVLDYQTYGCFIELKKDGVRLKKRDGTWASEHIAEQAAVLEQLASNGYIAQFAVGLTEACALIDSYLGAAS